MTLETTTRRPVLVDATPPDDPRDCCRAALAHMGDDFHDAKDLARDTLALTFAALPDLFPDDPNAIECVRRCIQRGEDALRSLFAHTDAVHDLIRHGAGDWRRSDAIIDARGRALDEGSDPDAAAEAATRAYDAQQEARA